MPEKERLFLYDSKKYCYNSMLLSLQLVLRTNTREQLIGIDRVPTKYEVVPQSALWTRRNFASNLICERVTEKGLRIIGALRSSVPKGG